MAKSEPKTGEKYKQIIEAAAIVFSSKGFYKAKVEEIAEKASVGKGTVYEYFDSKKQLFQEMLIYISEKYQQAVEEQVQKAESFSEKLTTLFAANFDFLKQHKEMARLLLAEHPPIGEEIRQWFTDRQQTNIRRVAELLDEALQRGEIKKVNNKLAAQVVLGALVFSGSQLIFDDKFDQQQAVQDLVEIISNGLVS